LSYVFLIALLPMGTGFNVQVGKSSQAEPFLKLGLLTKQVVRIFLRELSITTDFIVNFGLNLDNALFNFLKLTRVDTQNA